MTLAINEHNNIFKKHTVTPQQIPFKPALDALQRIHLPTLKIKSSIIFPPTLNLHITVDGLFEQKRGATICGGRITIIAGKARVRGNLELESFRLETGHLLDMKGSQFNLDGKMDLCGKQLLLDKVKGRAGSFNTVAQEQSNFTDLTVHTDFEQKHRFGKATWSQCLLQSETDNIALGGTDGDLHHVKLMAPYGAVGIKAGWVYGDHLRICSGKRSQIIAARQRQHHGRLVSGQGMLFDGDDITLYETTLKVGTALRVNGEQIHLPGLKVLSAELFKIAVKARIVDLSRANVNVDRLIVKAQEQILLNDLTTRLKEGSIHTDQGWIEAVGLSPTLNRDLKLTAPNGGIYIYDPNMSVGNSVKIVGQRVDLRRGNITSKGENEVVGDKGVYSYQVCRKGETVSTEATHGTFYDDASETVGKRLKREAQLLVARKVNEVGDQSQWKAATVNASHADVDSKNGIAIAAHSEARVFQSKIVAEDGSVTVQAPEQSMRKTIVKAKKLQQAGDKIDGDHMRVVACEMERVASQMVSSRYAASRIKGDSHQSAPFIDEDHSKVNVKGHDTIDAGDGIVTMADSKRTISSGEVRSGFLDQRGLVETVERGESKVETGILQNDEHTKHRGSGDSIALVDREFVDYSTTISTGLRSVTVNEGPYKLAGKVDARRGILSTPFDVTVEDQYHVSESGSIAGKRFHNLGKVRSEGTLHIKQEQYFPIYDASAKQKLHLTARGDLIPTRGFDAEGDIEFESLEGRTDLLYPVNAEGRGTWRAAKGAVDFHAPVELRDGITVQSETFNAHDILRTRGPNSIDVDWLNLQRAKIRLQGETDIEARHGAVNSGSEFFILGDTNWRGGAYENFSEMHLEEIVNRSGGGFFGPGLRKWDSKWVVDYLANTQILGNLNVDWNVGTYKNKGLFKCRSMKGYIASAELEVSSTEGKMPDLPEHEDLMPELPSETINDTQTLEGTDLLVENYIQKGGNCSSKGLNRMKGLKWSVSNRERKTREEYSCSDFWSSWTRIRELNTQDSIGNFDGEFTLLDYDKVTLEGARLHAKKHLGIKAGEYLQKAMVTDSLHHYDTGDGGFGVTEGASVRKVMMPAMTRSEGTLHFDITGKYSSLGSCTSCVDDGIITAGEVDEKSLFSEFVSSQSRGAFSHSLKRDVDVLQGGAFSEKANFDVRSRIGDIHWEGIFGTGKDGTMKSARELGIVSNHQTVHNESSGFSFTPTSMTWSTSEWSTTRATVPLFSIGRNLNLEAGSRLHLRGIQADVGGEVTTQFDERLVEPHQHTNYFARDGVSLSVSASAGLMTTDAIESALSGGDVGMTLANRIPLVKAFSDMSQAQGAGIPIQMASSFAKLRQFAKKPTDFMNPSVSVRLGAFSERSEWTESFLPYFKVGGNVTNEGDYSRNIGLEYDVEGKVIDRGTTVIYEDQADRSSFERIDAGVSVSFSAAGVTASADFSLNGSDSTRYRPWRVSAKGGHIIDARDRFLTHQEDTDESYGFSISGNIWSSDKDADIGVTNLGVQTPGMRFNADIDTMRRVFTPKKKGEELKPLERKVPVEIVEVAEEPKQEINLGLPLENSAPTLLDEFQIAREREVALYNHRLNVSADQEKEPWYVSANKSSMRDAFERNRAGVQAAKLAIDGLGVVVSGIGYVAKKSYEVSKPLLDVAFSDEIKLVEMTGAAARSTGGTIKKGVIYTCNLHPILEQSCQRVVDAYDRSSQWVGETYQSLKTTANNPRALPALLEHELGIPREVGVSYARDSMEVSSFIAETAAINKALSVGGRVYRNFKASRNPSNLSDWQHAFGPSFFRDGRRFNTPLEQLLRPWEGPSAEQMMQMKNITPKKIVHRLPGPVKLESFPGPSSYNEPVKKLPPPQKSKGLPSPSASTKGSDTSVPSSSHTQNSTKRSKLPGHKRYVRKLDDAVGVVPIGIEKSSGSRSIDMSNTASCYRSEKKVVESVVRSAIAIPKITRSNPVEIDVEGVMNGSIIPAYGELQTSPPIQSFVHGYWGNSGYRKKGTKLGHSHNDVHMIQRVGGEPIAVVKDFQATRSTKRGFIPDIVATSQIQGRNLEYSIIPDILAIGRYTSRDGSERGLTMYEFIPGPTAQEMMSDLRHFPAEKIGRAVGELNAAGRDLPVSTEYLEPMIETFNLVAGSAIKQVRRLGLPLKFSEKDMRMIAYDLRKNPGKAGFVHGDLHNANIIVSDRGIAIIDPGSYMESVNRLGVPHGMAAIDRFSMIVSIRATAAKNGWSTVETEGVISDFLKGYSRFESVENTPSSRFAEAYWEMFLLNNLVYKASDSHLLETTLERVNANFGRTIPKSAPSTNSSVSTQTEGGLSFINETHPLFNIHDEFRRQSNNKWIHYSGIGRGIVKGGNISAVCREIGGKSVACFRFSLTQPAREKLQKWLSESSQSKRGKVQVSEEDYYFNGKDFFGEFHPLWNRKLETKANIIEFDGLGRIVVGQDPEWRTLYNRVSVELHDFNGSGVAPKNMHQMFSNIGLEEALLVNRVEDELRIKMMQLFKAYFPAKSYQFSVSSKTYNSSISDLKFQIMQAEPKMFGIFNKYLHEQPNLMPRIEIDKGRFVWGIGDLSSQMRQQGAWGLQHEIKNNDKLPEILINGLQSSVERFDHSKWIHGQSTQSDLKHGSGDQVFMRLVTEKNVNVWCGDDITTNVLIDLSVVNRGGYAYLKDEFGTKDPSIYARRPNWIEFVKNAGDKGEVMSKHRIGPECIRGIVVLDQKVKAEVIEKLRQYDHFSDQKIIQATSKGEHILGKPIDEFIHVWGAFKKEMWNSKGTGSLPRGTGVLSE